jgi:hypothetical protein
MLRQVWSDENYRLLIRIIIIIVCSGACMRSAVTVATAILRYQLCTHWFCFSFCNSWFRRLIGRLHIYEMLFYEVFQGSRNQNWNNYYLVIFPRLDEKTFKIQVIYINRKHLNSYLYIIGVRTMMYDLTRRSPPKNFVRPYNLSLRVSGLYFNWCCLNLMYFIPKIFDKE